MTGRIKKPQPDEQGWRDIINEILPDGSRILRYITKKTVETKPDIVEIVVQNDTSVSILR